MRTPTFELKHILKNGFDLTYYSGKSEHLIIEAILTITNNDGKEYPILIRSEGVGDNREDAFRIASDNLMQGHLILQIDLNDLQFLNLCKSEISPSFHPHFMNKASQFIDLTKIKLKWNASQLIFNSKVQQTTITVKDPYEITSDYLRKKYQSSALGLMISSSA